MRDEDQEQLADALVLEQRQLIAEALEMLPAEHAEMMRFMVNVANTALKLDIAAMIFMGDTKSSRSCHLRMVSRIPAPPLENLHAALTSWMGFIPVKREMEK